MKNLWPLVLLGVAFFMWNNKSCNVASQLPSLPHTAARPNESVSGGPVRQWEHEATDMTAREQALPAPGGLSARAMVDTARQGLQKNE